MAWFKKPKFLKRRIVEAPKSAGGVDWVKCTKCEAMVLRSDFEKNLSVCSACGHHHRMGAKARIASLVDAGSFVEWDAEINSSDPLGFVDSKPYTERIAAANAKSGPGDAVRAGKATIQKRPVVLGVMDFGYLGGSMGSALGEKVTRMIEQATKEKLPAIAVTASGGARMQEGILSLMQMAKTSAAVGRHREAGLPFIVILADPTTGGTTASFAMLGDVILAEPEALVGFAGPRVIEQTIRQKLPEGFQRSEFVQDHGFIDAIVKRTELPETIVRFLDFFGSEKSKKEGRQIKTKSSLSLGNVDW